jgi:hypothetical protein
MEADMFQTMDASPNSRPAREIDANPRSLVERVRDAAAKLASSSIWARTSGRHVLLGLEHDEAFARLTPLGGAAYGLAFRTLAPDADESALEETPAALASPRWEPVLLVDGLADVVEHALIAVDALASHS